MCLLYKEDQEGHSSHLIFVDIQRVAQEMECSLFRWRWVWLSLSVLCFHYNEKHEKKQTRGEKINRSTYFCVWSLVLSLLPMPSPAINPTLRDYCCLLGINPLAEQILSFSSRVFPLISSSRGSMAIYSNVSQSFTPPRANSIGNCQLFTIHVASNYLHKNKNTNINIICTHMCLYIYIYINCF